MSEKRREDLGYRCENVVVRYQKDGVVHANIAHIHKGENYRMVLPAGTVKKEEATIIKEIHLTPVWIENKNFAGWVFASGASPQLQSIKNIGENLGIESADITIRSKPWKKPENNIVTF